MRTGFCRGSCLGGVGVVRCWRVQYWCRSAGRPHYHPIISVSARPVAEGPYRWKSHREGPEEWQPVSPMTCLGPQWGGGGHRSIFIRRRQQEINKRPVKRNSEGTPLGCGGGVGDGGRMEPWDRCWRKSLKCLFFNWWLPPCLLLVVHGLCWL